VPVVLFGLGGGFPAFRRSDPLADVPGAIFFLEEGEGVAVGASVGRNHKVAARADGQAERSRSGGVLLAEGSDDAAAGKDALGARPAEGGAGTGGSGVVGGEEVEAEKGG